MNSHSHHVRMCPLLSHFPQCLYLTSPDNRKGWEHSLASVIGSTVTVWDHSSRAKLNGYTVRDVRKLHLGRPCYSANTYSGTTYGKRDPKAGLPACPTRPSPGEQPYLAVLMFS